MSSKESVAGSVVASHESAVILLEGVGKHTNVLPSLPIDFGKRCGPVEARKKVRHPTSLWPWRRSIYK